MDFWLIGFTACLFAGGTGGQNLATLITVPKSFSFDLSKAIMSTSCPTYTTVTGWNLTIEFKSAGLIACHDDVNVDIGVELGNTLDSDNIYYMIQVSDSACVNNVDPNDDTNCFPGSNPVQTHDVTGYVYIQDIYAGKVKGDKDTLMGSFLTPATGVTVLQRYIVTGIDNDPPYATSDNFVYFCVVVQAYDTNLNDQCPDIPQFPEYLETLCYG